MKTRKENDEFQVFIKDFFTKKSLWYPVAEQTIVLEGNRTRVNLVGYNFYFAVTEKKAHEIADYLGLRIVSNKDETRKAIAQGSCVRCGKCCERYGDHIELDFSDVKRWLRQGRHDILRKMDPRMPEEGWLNPRTGDPYYNGKCPWLKRDISGRCLCLIQDTKPKTCSGFPFSVTQLQEVLCEGFPWKDVLAGFAFGRDRVEMPRVAKKKGQPCSPQKTH